MNWRTKFKERTLTWSCSMCGFSSRGMHSCGSAPDPHFFRAKTLRSARLRRGVGTDSEEGSNCNAFHISALVSDRSGYQRLGRQVYENSSAKKFRSGSLAYASLSLRLPGVCMRLGESWKALASPLSACIRPHPFSSFGRQGVRKCGH